MSGASSGLATGSGGRACGWGGLVLMGGWVCPSFRVGVGSWPHVASHAVPLPVCHHWLRPALICIAVATADHCVLVQCWPTRDAPCTAPTILPRQLGVVCNTAAKSE
eukprot:12119168-Alexandrium_andersonii.AAC.1